MSKRDRKNRARPRKQTTGQRQAAGSHQTTAARNRRRRQARQSAALSQNRLLAHAGSTCTECGAPIEWFRAIELKQYDPALFREFEEFFGPDQVQQADAWICTNCDAFGIVPDEDDGGLPYDEEFLEIYDEEILDLANDLEDSVCRECGGTVDWLDPAQVASIDKATYMQAKKEFGAAALLDGDAAVCRSCGTITFYPDWDAEF